MVAIKAVRAYFYQAGNYDDDEADAEGGEMNGLPYLDTDTLCAECLQPLMCRPKQTPMSFVIQGMEPMEYRHKHEGLCKTPKPYSGWNQREKWEREAR